MSGISVGSRVMVVHDQMTAVRRTQYANCAAGTVESLCNGNQGIGAGCWVVLDTGAIAYLLLGELRPEPGESDHRLRLMAEREAASP